jgi:hypothetical protein
MRISLMYVEYKNLLNLNILCHMICLLLLLKTLNLSHFPSDWRNLLWWLALVWHVASWYVLASMT